MKQKQDLMLTLFVMRPLMSRDKKIQRKPGGVRTQEDFREFLQEKFD